MGCPFRVLGVGWGGEEISLFQWWVPRRRAVTSELSLFIYVQYICQSTLLFLCYGYVINNIISNISVNVLKTSML